MAERSEHVYIPLEKLGEKDVRTVAINYAVQEVLKAYLEYAKDVLELSMSKSGYDAQRYKDIGDELVLTPKELVELINKLQVAFSDID